MPDATKSSSWGAPGAMSPIETMFWRVETGVVPKSTIVSLEILAGEPIWADVVRAHERAVAAVPRLSERVVESPVPIAAPRWSRDPHFDLNDHLRRAVLPRGSTISDLLDTASAVAMQPFDKSRPPWEAVLYTGLTGGRSAYLLKLHHSATDGTGVVQLLAHLHDHADGRPDRNETVDRADAPGLTASGALVTDLSERLRAIPGQVKTLSDLARRFARDPRMSARSGLEYGLSLRRLMTQPSAAPSPLLAVRSGRGRLGGIEFDLDQIRAVARATDSTINDVFLAGLLGGYRIYHEKAGVAIDGIPVSIPVSTRKEGDPDGGNLFVPARFTGPVAVVDPRLRIGAVGRAVKHARSEAALDHLIRIAPLLATLPGSAIAHIASGATEGNDLQASNVRGTSVPVSLCGQNVERLFPFAPLPGCPAMITMISHVEVVCVGVNYDPGSFEDGEGFLDALVDGFVEVLALDGKAPTARRAS